MVDFEFQFVFVHVNMAWMRGLALLMADPWYVLDLWKDAVQSGCKLGAQHNEALESKVKEYLLVLHAGREEAAKSNNMLKY